MSEITKFMKSITAGFNQEDADKVIRDLERKWSIFKHLSDAHFVSEFTSGDNEKLVSRYWEMYLGCYFLENGFEVSSADEGPDFCVTIGGKKCWVEAVVPSPGLGDNRLPEEYLNPFVDGENRSEVKVVDFPNEEILLRWTSSIDQKWRMHSRYRANDIVGIGDHYVIAVNSCLLGSGGGDGISGYPMALESVYPIGPQVVTVDRNSGKAISTNLKYRPAVTNANGASVLTDRFIRVEYGVISGLIAAHVHPFITRSKGDGLLLAHHLNAWMPLEKEVFPFVDEYWLEADGYMAYKVKDRIR
jgi:type I restriction enzyme S subunit